MEDNVAKIKERLDIVDLVGGYLKLQKAGINFKANCPFHNEKTPSFFVSPDRQIWHCFGCNLSGDHFKFLMQIEGLEFIEALRVLAKRAGIEIKGYNRELAGEKNKSYEISELAAKFFEKQLWESESGKKTLEYLKNRGLKIETIKEWHLGYAPNTWNSLKKFLKDAGFREEEIFKTGLTVKKDEENFYDRFRGRIMFPVKDLNSQVVGFTGRIFEEVTGETEMGKYINTPQTAIYDKSRLLYGLDKAKIDIKKNDRAVVVEGNMDLIMSHQAGVKNAVACSGTALTGWHLKIIKRYTSNLDLCFDQDSAGETAAKRGIDLALSQGFNVGLINLAAKDPADLIKENSQEWLEASKKNQPIIQFYLEKALAKHDIKTALGKKNIAGEVLQAVKLVENKVEQAHWLDELSNKLRVSQKILVEMLAAVKPGAGSRRPEDGSRRLEAGQGFEPASRLILEETLLALLMKMPQKAKETNPPAGGLPVPEEEFEIFQDKLYNNVFQRLKTGQGFIEAPLSYEDNLRLELVKFKSDQFFGDLEEKDLESEIGRLIKSLKKELILEKIKDLEVKIKEAKSHEVLSLLKEVQKFSTKLASL